MSKFLPQRCPASAGRADGPASVEETHKWGNVHSKADPRRESHAIPGPQTHCADTPLALFAEFVRDELVRHATSITRFEPTALNENSMEFSP